MTNTLQNTNHKNVHIFNVYSLLYDLKHNSQKKEHVKLYTRFWAKALLVLMSLVFMPLSIHVGSRLLGDLIIDLNFFDKHLLCDIFMLYIWFLK